MAETSGAQKSAFIEQTEAWINDWASTLKIGLRKRDENKPDTRRTPTRFARPTSYFAIAGVSCLIVGLGLFGCARPNYPSMSTASSATLPKPVAHIEVVKRSAESSPDCPVTVMIVNRMTSAWDGASFHVVLRDERNEAIGELQGVPLKYVDPKRGMVFSSVVRGAKCERIARLNLLYFGYYPTGQAQVRVPEALVTTGLK